MEGAENGGCRECRVQRMEGIEHGGYRAWRI